MVHIDSLTDGFKTFKATTYEQHRDMILHLVDQGHKPSTLFIASAGMRISPDKITSSRPGDLYVIRNVAGLVPPYESTGANGIISAIEHAVSTLEVENIVLLGNAHSSAIKFLMSDEFHPEDANDHVSTWLSIGMEARNAVKEQLADLSQEEQERACEQEILLVSLRNLLGYPCVEERINQGKLNLYAWHFNIRDGELKSFNPGNGQFELIG